MNSVFSPDVQPRCERCRAPLTSGSTFCETCGTRVTGSAQEGAEALSPSIDSSALSQPYSRPSMPARAPDPGDERLPQNALLVGSAAPNETYLGHRLTYTDAGTNFDPLANANYQRTLLTQFLGTFATWVIGSIVLFVVFGIAGIAQQITMLQEDPFGTVSGDLPTSPVWVIWQLLWGAWSLGLACLFFLRKLSVQLSEWMLTVDGRGNAAGPALDHMYTIIAARRTPISQMKVVRLAPKQQQARNYLQVDDGVFTGFVSCFPYGADLFIGWTFWLNMSPGRWLFMSLQRLVSGGSGIYGSLAHDQPKALREVLHSAVRQGVDIATGDVEPLGQGAIGYSVQPTTVAL